MWKCLVLLVFIQRVILSQPVGHVSIREARNLNYEECCPCPSSERSSTKDHVSWGSQVPHDCPCHGVSDSDAASSIIRPAFRAVEPFVRPLGTTNEPKPLLRPEVGLASSVLETLREVTNQEYQDALARDAARSAISVAESNSREQNSPRNIVNIILKPKNSYTDDIIPEASHVQETRCIQQPSGGISGLQENRQHRFRNSLLPLSKVTSNGLIPKKIFDMDNSASNIQEQILQPLRSNLFEDLKLKSELLKMKLFPGIANSLGDARTPLNIESGKINNFKLPSLQNNIIIPKENDHLTLTTGTSNMNKPRESEIIPSSSNLEFRRNSPQSSLSKINSKFDTKRKSLNSKPTNKNNVSHQLESTLPYNTNERNDIDITELTDNGNCDVNNGIENNDVTNDNHIQTLDTIPSPSEISELKPSVVDDVPQIHDNIVDEENIDTNSLGDNSQHKIVEDIVPSNFNEQLYEENLDTEQLNSIDSVCETPNDKDETLCDVKDIEAGANNNIPQATNILENINTNEQLNNVNEFTDTDKSNSNEQRSNNENAPTNENIIVDNSNKGNNLPNIKENILKTLENFKKTNEKIQEKLKSNVQDALQSLVVKKHPVIKMEDDDNPKNDIGIKDLQEMSNRILNLSNIEEDEKSRHVQDMSDSMENRPIDLKYEDSNKQSNNDYVRASQLDNVSEPVKDISYSPNLKLENSREINTEYNNQELKEVEPKKLDDPCVKSAKKSFSIESDTDLDQHEMISEASSPIITSTHHVIQPNKFKVKNVLDNFKTSVTDLFNNQRESKFNSPLNDNENDNTMIKTAFEKNTQTSDNYIARKNNNHNLNLHPNVKNSDSNLNSYKARIAVPTSLNRDTYRAIPEYTSPFNTLRSQIDTLSPINLKTIVGHDDRHKGISNSKSQVFNTLRNSHSSDNSYAKADNVLKNIHDAFDLPLTKTILRSTNKANPREIFGSIAKTNDDLSEKFRAFHLELNDKLSSFSQKISDIKPLQLKSEPRYRYIKSNSNLKHTKLPAIKDNTSVLSAEKYLSKLNYPQSSSKITDISKPKLIQKLKGPVPSKLDSKNSPSISRPIKLNNDITKRKGIKLKPLKDNKVIITFTTTVRPNLTLRRKNSLTSQSTKLPDVKSKNKSSEQRSSASEKIASRVPFSERRSHNEHQMPNYNEKSPKSELHGDSRSNMNSEETNGRKAPNSVLSKIREAVKIRANAEASRKIDSNNMLRSEADGAASASDMNAVALKDRSLQQNVSYKCKMMCFEDHDDA